MSAVLKKHIAESQGETMLGLVDGVFRRIETGCHAVYVRNIRIMRENNVRKFRIMTERQRCMNPWQKG